jgi:DNA segregation ATPase FtsK/SpoIIIE-like protein
MVNATSTSVRHPWTTTKVWGWRLELFLGLATACVLSLSLTINRDAPVVVLAVTAVLVLSQPKLRRRFEARALENHESMRLHFVMLHCGLANRLGQIPTATKVTQLGVAHRFMLKLPVGIDFALVEAKCNQIAAGMGARKVRATSNPANAQFCELVVIRGNAFPTVVPMPELRTPSISLWSPQPFGVGEDGRFIDITLPEHNLLIGGEPGSGKSIALSVLITMTALDPSVTLTLLDGKQVELAAWSPLADLFVGPDQVEACQALDYLRGLMDTRYDILLTERQRKLTKHSGFGLHVVVIDELAFYLRSGKKDQREQFAESLRDLVSRGRAAGIIVIAATQKPSHDVVPTWIRDLFAYRLAMRCSSNDASDTILGSGWAQRGYTATSIDPTNRGVGLLLAEGGVPVLLKTPFIADRKIDEIVSYALHLRAK